MADHIVRCMTTPPSLSGLTSASLGWASLTPASAQTHFSTVRYHHSKGRNCPHGGGVTHCVLQWQSCSGLNFRRVSRLPVSIYVSIYNGIVSLSGEIHAVPGSLQAPGNTFSPGRATPDWDRI